MNNDEWTGDEWTGFVAHMPALHPGAGPEEIKARNERMLMHALSMRSTVAVVGSGCSQPLGYPSWGEFACRVIDCTKANAKSAPTATLENFSRQITLSPSSDLLMFYIGACIDMLQRDDALECYRQLVGELFRLKPEQTQSESGFYPQLLELPITRFFTTNFDCEIEFALEDCGKVPRGTFLQKGQVRPEAADSFHQRSENFEAFAGFALAGGDYKVFHCHGRYDDPDSIVASERNYQDTYLADSERSSIAYRQCIEVLLGSNPLLFVGYSLNDEDLLRPLRYLAAVDPQRKQARPIFALLPHRKDEDAHRHAMLSERYGLKVITYELAEDGDQTKEVRAKLEKLAKQYSSGWQAWLGKPRLRKAISVLSMPEPFMPLGMACVPFGGLVDFENRILKGLPGIICLEGPSGTGKSRHCINVLGSSELQIRFDGAFYWNFHYGHDLLSALDTMLHYFKCAAGLQNCLQQRYLIILDGCERLLRQKGAGTRGVPYSSRFRRLLNVAMETNLKATLVLSGRLLPQEVDKERDGVARAEVFRVPRLRFTDLSETTTLNGLRVQDEDRVTALCEVLQGHSYGLLMADRYLELQGGTPAELRTLVSRLAAHRAGRRLHHVIEALLQRLDQMYSGMASPFLRRLALFLSPVGEHTVEMCFQQVAASAGRKDACEADKKSLMAMLERCGFLFQVSRGATWAYCVQATARSRLFETVHGQSADALPDFGLTGPLSGRVGVDPGRDGEKDIKGLYMQLVDLAEEKVVLKEIETARLLCRDAFALIRGRMEANTASRWSDFETYAQYPIRTAILAKRVSPVPAWTYADAAATVEDEQSPLHLGELAWLYNDAAISLYHQGYVRDAYSLWEQTVEIGKLAGSVDEVGSLQIEGRLSMISCFIEMGRLPAARRALEDLQRSYALAGKGEVGARVRGLWALINHLHGNLPEAERLYRKCLKRLRGDNLRGTSFFEKCYADLLKALGKLGEAEEHVLASRALAEAGAFPDLVLFARITEAHLLVARQRSGDAIAEYRSLLREAQDLKLRRQEAEIEFSIAYCALLQGDAESARQMALNSLRIANEHGLGLRVTHSLVILARAMIAIGGVGNRRLGVAYLREAKLRGHRQEYWHREREAELRLQELGEK
jgi:tetratricopeptide (TPR) repeat protein